MLNFPNLLEFRAELALVVHKLFTQRIFTPSKLIGGLYVSVNDGDFFSMGLDPTARTIVSIPDPQHPLLSRMEAVVFCTTSVPIGVMEVSVWGLTTCIYWYKPVSTPPAPDKGAPSEYPPHLSLLWWACIHGHRAI